jgi:hypothetical protein
MQVQNLLFDALFQTQSSVFNICRPRLAALSLCTLLASGCHAKPGQAQTDNDIVPSRKPTSSDMLKVTAPNYKLVAGAKSECLGRLAFEVREQFEWPLYFYSDSFSSFFARSFSANVEARFDTMRFGTTRIAVIGSVGGVKKEKILEVTPAALDAGLEKNISETRASIEEQRRTIKNLKDFQEAIKDQEQWIRGWEKTLKEDRETFKPFEPGVPNSQGYWTSTTEGNVDTNLYSILRAYLTRGEHIFVFESKVKMNTSADKEKHQRDFSAMLAKFRPRAANEIPTEPGVCIPFGFISDDGRTPIEFKQSLRYPDAPGVLYTIATGSVDPRSPKATLITAAADASLNPPTPTEQDKVKAVVTQRIGPHMVKLGGLTAPQGGTIMQARAGGETYDIYSVFTGYSGWLGTDVLPYILVELHTLTKVHAEELKQNPPPFKQSKERLDILLGSMRWRPTDPPMPEFKGK